MKLKIGWCYIALHDTPKQKKQKNDDKYPHRWLNFECSTPSLKRIPPPLVKGNAPVLLSVLKAIRHSVLPSIAISICYNSIQGPLFPVSYNIFFDFKYDLTLKIQSPKNHWTLEWRGLNLYSRGQWFDGERLARKSWSSLPPIGCNRWSHWHLTARYPK